MWNFELNSFFLPINDFGGKIWKSGGKMSCLITSKQCVHIAYININAYTCVQEAIMESRESKAKKCIFMWGGGVKDLEERNGQGKGKTTIKTGTNHAIENPTILEDTVPKGKGGVVAFMVCMCDTEWWCVRKGHLSTGRLNGRILIYGFSGKV